MKPRALLSLPRLSLGNIDCVDNLQKVTCVWCTCDVSMSVFMHLAFESWLVLSVTWMQASFCVHECLVFPSSKLSVCER